MITILTYSRELSQYIVYPCSRNVTTYFPVLKDVSMVIPQSSSVQEQRSSTVPNTLDSLVSRTAKTMKLPPSAVIHVTDIGRPDGVENN